MEDLEREIFELLPFSNENRVCLLNQQKTNSKLEISKKQYLILQKEDIRKIMREWKFDFRIENIENKHFFLFFLKTIEILNTKISIGDFIEFIEHLDQYPLLNKINLPPFVSRILSSKACRNAVKFGDFLKPQDCQFLIDKISDCNFPFSCAHGRPTISILMDFNLIKLK